jgi:hypothetical protein
MPDNFYCRLLISNVVKFRLVGSKIKNTHKQAYRWTDIFFPLHINLMHFVQRAHNMSATKVTKLSRLDISCDS